MLLVVTRYAYKNRKTFYSIISAFALLMMIVAYCVQNGKFATLI
jgi:hypothetical protein